MYNLLTLTNKNIFKILKSQIFSKKYIQKIKYPEGAIKNVIE